MIEIKIIADTQEDKEIIFHRELRKNNYNKSEIAIIVYEMERLKCELFHLSDQISPLFEVKGNPDENKPDENKP